MEFISPHKYIKNTSTNGIILTKHQLKLAEDLRGLKGQERSPSDWVGYKKEGGKKRGSRVRLVPRGGGI